MLCLLQNNYDYDCQTLHVHACTCVNVSFKVDHMHAQPILLHAIVHHSRFI